MVQDEQNEVQDGQDEAQVFHVQKFNNFGHETAWPNMAKMKRKMTKISLRSHEYEAHDSLHA